MSPHVSADPYLKAENVEKAKSRFAQGMLPGGRLYQTRCGRVVAALTKCTLALTCAAVGVSCVCVASV